MFFLLPLGVDYRAQRYPVVTFTLIGINVVAFLAAFCFEWSGGEEATRAMYRNFWLVPADLHWHTLLTSMFVHGGWMHLLGNMVYLFLFGSCVEDLIGRRKFVLFYLLGGLAADLTHMALMSGAGASLPTGGASGAISACIGGFVLLLPKTGINFHYWYWILMRFGSGEFWLPSWLVISFWFLGDVVGAVLDAGSGHGGVAFGAHVGGFVGGFAFVGFRIAYQRHADRKAAAAASTPTRVVTPLAVTTPVVAPTPAPPVETPCIYLLAGEVQTGPFTLSEVGQMLADGRVGDDALYWSEGMENWQSVAELR